MDFELKQQEFKIKHKQPSYYKEDKINAHIREWNTIPHIYRIKSLLSLYNKLYLLTFDHKLECLNYYIDHERDSENGEEYIVMSAEIKDTWSLPIKERFIMHAQLLKRVLSNDKTLVYCDNVFVQADDGQLSLFG